MEHRSLHTDPPFSPATSFGPPRQLMLALFGVVVVLTGAAAYNDSQILRLWDEPLQDFVEGHRPELLTQVLELLTLLGHQNAILPATALFVAIAWRRCRMAALVLIAFTVARILIHLGLKDGIARERPNLDPLVDAVGNSYASGHVISAVLIWGFVPFMVGLLTTRRGLWYAAVVAAVVVMVSSTVSRFYLGVHWFTDSVVGLLIGLGLLVAADDIIRRHHAGRRLAPGRLGDALARVPVICDAAPGASGQLAGEVPEATSRSTAKMGAPKVDLDDKDAVRSVLDE